MKTRLLLTALFVLAVGSPGLAKDDITKELITSQGRTRVYYLYVPSTLKAGTTAPLIVTLHGSNRTVAELMEEVTGLKPKMWGPSIVGFGSYHYKYASGQEGDWPMVGFSPRKQNLTLYIMPGFDQYDELMKKLGKHSTAKSCLYIKRLDDVHLPTLKKLVRESVKYMKKKYK